MKKRATRGRGRPPKRGRPSVWRKIKPHLDKMVELYAHGATIEQIAKHLGISTSVFYKLRAEVPELAKAWKIAREAQEDTLVGELWKIAMGGATEEGMEWKESDANGNLVTKRKVKKASAQLPAILALLRHYHGWSKPRGKGRQDSAPLNNIVEYLPDQMLREVMAQRLRMV